MAVVTGLSERARVYSFGDQCDLHRCMQMRREGTTAKTGRKIDIQRALERIGRWHWFARGAASDSDLLLKWTPLKLSTRYTIQIQKNSWNSEPVATNSYSLIVVEDVNRFAFGSRVTGRSSCPQFHGNWPGNGHVLGRNFTVHCNLGRIRSKILWAFFRIID